MNDVNAVILVVSKPGLVRNGLHSLVSAMPGLGAIMTADTGLLALKTAKEKPPTLVLIGNDLPNAEVIELVRQLKREHPKTHCLVLTDNMQQRDTVSAAGADRVIPNGTPFGQMLTVIQQMLEETHPAVDPGL